MGFILVICSPTVRISFGPNSIKPVTIPTAPITMTQRGMPTLPEMSPVSAALTMAASGPTALATSFEPCAKDSRAVEQIKGMVKRLRTDLLRFSITLDGETDRTLVGDAMSGGRPAKLYEVHVERHGRSEKYYQWVDAERGLLLKLLSQDRDWSIEYEHVVFSDQPDFYFEVPRGYQRIDAPEPEGELG